MIREMEKQTGSSRPVSYEVLKKKRSAVLHQMQLMGIDTANWAAVDNFCLGVRIAGKKFRELGEAGLEDRRGKKIAAQKPRTELEELKIKMAQLEYENYMLRMERDLLKKLDELERRDAFRK